MLSSLCVLLRGSHSIPSKPARASRHRFAVHLSMTRGRVERRSHPRMTHRRVEARSHLRVTR